MTGADRFVWRSRMAIFDDDELHDSDTGENSIHRVLGDLTPRGERAPLLYQRDGHLFVAFPTVATCALFQFRSAFVFRNGHPSLDHRDGYWLYESGVDSPGIFFVSDSSAVASARDTWVGRRLPTSESWNLSHYVVVFPGGCLECVCSSVWYMTGDETQSPADLMALVVTSG